MTSSIILHHYDGSPYAEKIRLMFGLANLEWRSLITSVQPPRPSLDLLTGGYRRIPVAQLGADVFCDSTIIASEIAAIAQSTALNPAAMEPAAKALANKAEKEVFFAAIAAVSPVRLIGTLFRQFGVIGAYRFVKDRATLFDGGTARPARGKEAAAILETFISELEAVLADQAWVGGDQASIADFSTYHPLWLHVSASRRPLTCGPKVQAWYQKVAQIGHGSRGEISKETAFLEAKEAEPRPLPADIESEGHPIGQEVHVGPADYGVVPVAGVLAAVTRDRIIVARSDAKLGNIHVHFPREGYSITAK